jgi:HEAT repeat protein
VSQPTPSAADDSTVPVAPTGTDHRDDRRRAALAGHTGDTDTARALLAHTDAKVRATALGALNRLGTLGSSELVDALEDPEPTMRRRACEETARWMRDLRSEIDRSGVDSSSAMPAPLPSEVSDALLRRLADEDPTVIETAAWACGERPPAPDGTLDRLIELATTHDDALCREAAVAALGALGDERGLPAILAATRDRATVRRRAVIALAPFDGPEVDAAIETARTDRDWQVRQAAEDLSP